MRLIDADEIKEQLSWCEVVRLSIKEINQIIDDIPTEEKRAQGEWIYDGFCVTTTQYKCNKCQTPSLNRSNFCPNCGAYMKGGETVAEDNLHNQGPRQHRTGA